jgi:hypothetical protein
MMIRGTQCDCKEFMEHTPEVASILRIIEKIEGYRPAVNNRVASWVMELKKDGWRME